MPWGTLIIAGLFEIAWAIGLKYATPDPEPNSKLETKASE